MQTCEEQMLKVASVGITKVVNITWLLDKKKIQDSGGPDRGPPLKYLCRMWNS